MTSRNYLDRVSRSSIPLREVTPVTAGAGEPRTDRIAREDAEFQEGGGEPGRRCSECVQYEVIQANGCALVPGTIRPGDVCGFFHPEDVPEPVAESAVVLRSPSIPAVFLTDPGDQFSSGIMVCLRPNEAEFIVREGGLPVEEIHLTLGYFGKTGDYDQEFRDELAHAVRLFAENAVDIVGEELVGEVSTVTTFQANPESPLIALVDAPGLGELRAGLVASLRNRQEQTGIAVADALRTDHDFTAHVTLGYEPTSEDVDAAMELVGTPVTFTALELEYGEDRMVRPFGVHHDAASPELRSGDDPEVQMRSTPLIARRSQTLAEDPDAVPDDGLVLIDGLDGVGGVVVSRETEGTHPGRGEEELEATEDDPVFLVRLWLFDEVAGEWQETDDVVGYRASEVTVIDALPVPEMEEETGDPEDEVEEELTAGSVRLQNAQRAESGEFEWEAVLILEGVESGDRRLIAEGALTWRDLPLTLMVQLQNPESGGHALAIPGGSIWEIERVGNEIVGRGFFDSGDGGTTLRRMLEEGTIRGVSADIDMVESEIRFEDEREDPLFILTSGRVMGATATPFPAFQEAFIRLLEVTEEEAETITASGGTVYDFDGTWYAFIEDGSTPVPETTEAST